MASRQSGNNQLAFTMCLNIDFANGQQSSSSIYTVYDLIIFNSNVALLIVSFAYFHHFWSSTRAVT